MEILEEKAVVNKKYLEIYYHLQRTDACFPGYVNKKSFPLNFI